MKFYNSEITAYLQKSRMPGLDIETITPNKIHCTTSPYYIVHKSADNKTVLIPDEAVYIEFRDTLKKIKCKLKVIGGSGLTSTQSMFNDFDAESLDLSEMDTSNVTNMVNMFTLCTAEVLDLSSFNTSKVVNMGSMFSFTYAQEINLNNFDTSNLEYIDGMFCASNVKYIDLRHFNLEKVKDMRDTFSGSKATAIDLRGVNLTEIEKLKEQGYDLLERIFFKYSGDLITDNKSLLNAYKDRWK